MTQERRACLVSGQSQVGAPVARWRGRQLYLARDRVSHEVEQILLAGNMPVERHRSRPKPGCDPAHGERLMPLGVSDLYRRPHDLLATQRGTVRARFAFHSGPDRSRSPTLLPAARPLIRPFTPGCAPATRAVACRARGIFLLTMVGTFGATAVGFATDMTRGVADRFRSLPIADTSILVGRTVADIVEASLGLCVLTVCGLVAGWSRADVRVRMRSRRGRRLACYFCSPSP
jgi:hypothetical protein